MSKLSDIFITYGKDYLSKYNKSILPSHKKAIKDITSCRSAALGGHQYKCKHCGSFHYSYHSCGNRNCGTCQNDKAEEWLNKNINLLLLPVDYFMITFTLPEEFREFARSNQRLFYNIMFRCSADTLAVFSSDKKYIGGKTGCLGVLHTWSRKLIYHPHIHYIITGGGLTEENKSLTEENKKWKQSGSKFIFPVKALSVVFKAKMRDSLKRLNPILFNQICPDVWRQDWVVNSIPVGSGKHAIKYLAQYVFRIAISNSRIISNENGFVTFKYKDAKTKQTRTAKVTAEEFIRRFLQHVLPRGFVKVRYYGLFSSGSRQLLNYARELFNLKVVDKNKKKNKKSAVVFYCPDCGKIMQLVAVLPRPRKTINENKPPPYESSFANNL